MGIHAYFNWIHRKYPDISFWDPTKKMDYFYFDYNSLVHPKTSTWLKDNYEKALKMSKDEIEKCLIEKTIEYTKFMIELINPTKMVYIAIDGVVPRAKMHQQRLRRFWTVKDIQLNESLRKRFNEEKSEVWSRNAISPGTEFMSKLSKELTKHIQSGYFHPSDNKNLKIELSDADEPGEGEHKIIPLIKQLKSTNQGKFSNVCIYGMDADLIILALSTKCENFYLLRDIQLKEPTVNSNEDYLMVSIDRFRSCIISELSVAGFSNDGLVDDYIFLTFFMGNDFLPHLPSIDIKNGGLDLIRNIYQQVLVTEKRNLVYFVDKVPHVDMDFFKKLVYKLSEGEEERLQRRRNFFFKQPANELSPYEKYKWMIEKVKMYDRNHPFYEIYKDEINYVNYGAKGWKSRFYQLNFGISKENLDEYNQYRRMICTLFFEGMMWTLRYYYLSQAPSWDWFYPFRKGPFMSDIYNSLHHIKSLNDLVFEEGSPVLPYQQLLYILPPQNSNLLKKEYAQLMTDPNSPIIDFYPCDFKLDVDGVELYWKTLPVLPLIDKKRLMTAIEEVNQKIGVPANSYFIDNKNSNHNKSNEKSNSILKNNGDENKSKSKSKSKAKTIKTKKTKSEKSNSKYENKDKNTDDKKVKIKLKTKKKSKKNEE